MKSFPFFAAALVLCSCGTAQKTSSYSQSDPEQAINIGYESVSGDKLTYSVTQVDTPSSEMVSYTNIWDYLRSRVPGIQIGQASAGSTPDITIRGIGSATSSTQPLILVDDQETSDISYLNPSDVASVSVLKDSSASMYGTRGANGVILITTKGAREAAAAEAAAKKAARQAAKDARKK